MHYDWPTTVIGSWEQFVNITSRLVRSTFLRHIYFGDSLAQIGI